jgi:hypothetical protein
MLEIHGCAPTLISVTAAQGVAPRGRPVVAFLPLDERFTTRDLWLNLANLTDYEASPIREDASDKSCARTTVRRRRCSIDLVLDTKASRHQRIRRIPLG